VRLVTGKRAVAGLLAACALMTGLRARAAEEEGGPIDASRYFKRGSLELLAGAGYGEDNSRSYLITQLGGGYYFRDGLSAGLTVEGWLGSRPQMYNASPYVRYVFLDSPWRYKPYAGIFYRRTSFSSGSAPIDSSGIRGGFVFPLTRRAYLTAGLVYEHDYEDAPLVSSDRDMLYPEIGLEFTF
jgi:hypothetical protein